MNSKIVTLNDVRKKKYALEAQRLYKADLIKAKSDKVKRALADNPHIGVLMRNGKVVYYTYKTGEYVESKSVFNLI